MQEITQWQAHTLAGLFGGLGDHLAVQAVLQGAAAGRIWADDPQQPGNGVLWTAHRVFVAGADSGAINAVVAEIAGEARARGDWGIGVYGPDATDWEAVLDGLTWRPLAREYWQAEVNAETAARSAGLAQHAAAAGLQLRAADSALLAQSGLERLNQLREEMCSERTSVEDFLARSFGVCLVDDGAQELAGWCLSEYNCGTACEVGIEVMEAHQRRGLGTLLTEALCAEAAGRGLTTVGWHCQAANTASRATAQRAGLRLMRQYAGPVVLLR
jgi:RimJ/RimL family protein N-acetyltransferase